MPHLCPQAYNRVVAPEQLVTSGPFALVQHPIYTSYMLLFAGHTLRWVGWVGSAAAGFVRRLISAGLVLLLAGPGTWLLHAHRYGRTPSRWCCRLTHRPLCSLGSPAAAAFLLLGCLLYYSGRTRLEEAVLEGAFGSQYRQYRSSTGRFLPRLL